MAIQIDKITDKYVSVLGKKKVFNMVKVGDAISSVKQAVEETATEARKEIEEAITPFKEKIAQKDEFISQQGVNNKKLQDKISELERVNENLKSEVKTKTDFIAEQGVNNKELKEENKILENENNDLKSKLEIKDKFIAKTEEENKSLHKQTDGLLVSAGEMFDTIDRYKAVYKEAYKQGITPELREQKSGIASILSGLIQHKSQQLKPKKTEQIIEKKVDAVQKNEVSSIPKEPPATTQPTITPDSKNTEQVRTKSVKKEKPPVVDKKVLQFINNERKHQVLDKDRMERATYIIKALLENAPTDSFIGIQEQFNKTKDKFIKLANNNVDKSKRQFVKENYGLIRCDYDKDDNIVMEARGLFESNKNAEPYKYKLFNKDKSFVEIYDGSSDSYIKFSDTEGKELLHIGYNPFDKNYMIFVSDKNGHSMVTTSVVNGVVKYMRVNFNDVKSTSDIVSDAPMNYYANNLIENAKNNTVSKTHIFRDTADINYFNSEGQQTVKEYYVNKLEDVPPPKGAVPVLTYLFNPKEEKLEKLINTGDLGIHAKFDKKLNKWIQYRTKGITSLDKYDKEGEAKTFGISFHRNTENEHFEVQSLYDKKYQDKNDSWQRPVYEKFNYGLASHPLTKFFTFYDLSQHNIKPWDFSILKDYIK